MENNKETPTDVSNNNSALGNSKVDNSASDSSGVNNNDDSMNIDSNNEERNIRQLENDLDDMNYARIAKRSRHESPKRLGAKDYIANDPIANNYIETFERVITGIVQIELQDHIVIPTNFSLIVPQLTNYLHFLGEKEALKIKLEEDYILSDLPYLALMTNFDHEEINRQTETVQKALCAFHSISANVIKPLARLSAVSDDPGAIFIRKCLTQAYFKKCDIVFHEKYLVKNISDAQVSASLNVLHTKGLFSSMIMNVAKKLCNILIDWVSSDTMMMERYGEIISTYLKNGPALLETCFNTKEEMRNTPQFTEKLKRNRNLRPGKNDTHKVICVVKPKVSDVGPIKQQEKIIVSVLNTELNNVNKILENQINNEPVCSRIRKSKEIVAKLHNVVNAIESVLISRKGVVHNMLKESRNKTLTDNNASPEEIERDKLRKFTPQEWAYQTELLTGRAVEEKILEILGYLPEQNITTDVLKHAVKSFLIEYWDSLR